MQRLGEAVDARSVLAQHELRIPQVKINSVVFKVVLSVNGVLLASGGRSSPPPESPAPFGSSAPGSA